MRGWVKKKEKKKEERMKPVKGEKNLNLFKNAAILKKIERGNNSL